MLEVLDRFCQERGIGLVMEADGSRRRPLKAPAPHEPPIPGFVDTVVVVAGLSALGQPLTSEWVYNPDLFAEISGIPMGSEITQNGLVKVLTHKMGGLKNVPSGARRIVLLNQADTFPIQESTNQLVQSLFGAYNAVVVNSFPTQYKGSLRDYLHPEIRAVHEPVAGVVLAAGGSKRLGMPKQLLDWRGKPLVWHAVQVALRSGLDPVLVITGAAADKVDSILDGVNVNIIHNPDWELGQGTSVSIGVKHLPAVCGSAIFFLADQPFIPEALINRLVETHSKTQASIVLPWVKDRPANPVLFDQRLFYDLSELSGDIGGRSLFSKFGVTKVLWNDPSILFDVDTLEDYQQLVRNEK
jgi:molybdenum cofactor cytidylyltransferase